jgi:adenine-specific DNA methylase
MMGWSERPDCLAKSIEFRSNDIEGMEFELDLSDQHHSYSVYWTLHIKVINKKGVAVENAEIRILDKNGIEVATQKTDENGSLSVELPEYSLDGSDKTFLSPYTIIAGKKKIEVQLNKNIDSTIVKR